MLPRKSPQLARLLTSFVRTTPLAITSAPGPTKDGVLPAERLQELVTVPKCQPALWNVTCLPAFCQATTAAAGRCLYGADTTVVKELGGQDEAVLEWEQV